MLDKLIKARLVRVSGGTTPDDEQIEVAHEALVRNWPTLVDWLEDERSALSMRRRLEAKAAEWVRLGRGSSGLLDREQLIEAEHWLAGFEAEYLGFDPTLPELVVFSRAAIEEAEQEHELIRQRELQQARALAEEQQRRAEAEQERAEAERKRAETEAGSNRRLKFLFRALALAAMLLVAAAVWAITQQRAAVEAGEIAQAERVTAEAARASADAARGTAIAQAIQLQTEVAKSSSSAATAQAEGARADSNAATAQAAQGAAERQQRLDRANLLAAVSGALATSQSQLSALVAVEAARVNAALQQAPSITATNALTQTLIGFGAVEQGFWQQQGPITSVAISADGARAISGSDQGAVWLWNVRDPDPAASAVALEGLSQAITIVIGNPNGTIDLRRFPGTALDASLRGHAGAITALAFNSDGSRLISSSADGTVRVWDVGRGAQPRLLRVLRGHEGAINAIALSANGDALVTGGNDQSIRAWGLASPAPSAASLPADTAALTALACRFAGREISAAEWQQYFDGKPYRKTCGT